MSYCRFSDDDWRSDIYAWEGDGGYVTHVAATRILGDVPPLPPLQTTPSKQWMDAHRVQMAFLHVAEREPIDLPSAGKSYVDGDLNAFIARLSALRAEGFHVPQSAIDEAIAERGGVEHARLTMLQGTMKWPERDEDGGLST